jgi:hypothetical protein
MTDAHDQSLTLRLIEHVPPHEPRESDPYYHLFRETKDRMRRLGLLRCAIPGCQYPGPIELHHEKVEFAFQAGVDLARFNDAYGLHLNDDDEFRAYIEGPGNLEPLCAVHHRTHLGVHAMPGPLWGLVRVWKDGTAPPAETAT